MQPSLVSTPKKTGIQPVIYLLKSLKGPLNMIEEVFTLSRSEERNVDKVVQDDNLDYIHMIFNKNEGLPEHFSNSNVYMTVLRGMLSISLDEQETHTYPAGTLLKIPYKTRMNVRNEHEDRLELLVIKAPAPKNYPRQ